MSPLSDATAARKLRAVNGQLAAMPGWKQGPKRLALLRQQAALGDQRDAAADKQRRAAHE